MLEARTKAELMKVTRTSGSGRRERWRFGEPRSVWTPSGWSCGSEARAKSIKQKYLGDGRNLTIPCRKSAVADGAVGTRLRKIRYRGESRKWGAFIETARTLRPRFTGPLAEAAQTLGWLLRARRTRVSGEQSSWKQGGRTSGGALDNVLPSGEPEARNERGRERTSRRWREN